MELLGTNVKRVRKVWGEEIWLVNCSLYCAKWLIINPGYTCSYHRHRKKDETFIVVEGSCRMEIDGNFIGLKVGNSVRLRPDTLHRFWLGPGDASCRILEVSTTHREEDVERVAASRPLKEGV